MTGRPSRYFSATRRGCAVGGDDLFQRGLGDRPVFLLGLFQDVAADLGQDLLPLLAAGKEMADLLEIGFQVLIHVYSP